MHSNRKTLAYTLMLTLSAMLAACGNDSGNAPSSAGASAGPTTPIVLQGTPSTAVMAGDAYSFIPTVVQGSGTIQFTIQGKPSWASFNANTGALSGTPTGTDAGSYPSIVISAGNGTTSASLPAFSVAVQGAPAPSTLAISGAPATSVVAGSSYSFMPVVSGAGSGSLSFSIQNKPSWATFSVSTGLVSGTPSSAAVGIHTNIIVSVSDGSSSTSLGAFAVQVQSAVPSNPNPVAVGNAGVAQGLTPIDVCTTALVGSHATYNVGPGRTYTELNAVPWGTLVAGDVVNIHARPTPYKTTFGLRAQGTATDPVVINGVTDTACKKPVLDFNGASAATGSNPGSGNNVFGTPAQYNEGLAGIVVKRGPSVQDAYGVYIPKWIIIQGLDVRGAYKGNSYTALDGSTQTYGSGGCIWIQQGQDITIRNNNVSDCAFGIFLMAKNDILPETTQRVTIANNRVWGHGVVGSYSEHNFYVQAASPIVEGNFIGQVRAGSTGSSYKSRSSGEIFRHNYVICSSLCLDLVQSEEQTGGIVLQPDYGTDYVYSNTIESSGPPAIHYGGDNMGEQNSQSITSVLFVPPVPYRKHLRFWNNTYTLTSSSYKLNVFRLSALETEVDAWNNTFNLNFSGVELSWLVFAGQLRFGPGNVTTGSVPGMDAQVGSTPGLYSVTNGASIPGDPRLAQLQ